MPEIINMQAAKETKQVMGENFSLMIEYFLEDTAMYMNSITEGLASKDAECIKIPAHTIKSSSKQLGADRLSELARQIEYLSTDILEGKAGDFDKLTSLFEELKAAFAEVEPEIKKLAN